MSCIDLRCFGLATALELALLLTLPSATFAQTAPGIRASGMGGAFVAVADDASAVFWNPAGLVFGPLANAQIDLSRDSASNEPVGAEARASSRFVGVAVLPLGISYYRLGSVALVPPSPAEPGPPGRESDRGHLHRLATTHVGVTVLQSIGDRLTVGATARIVRGGAAGQPLLPSDEAAAEDDALTRAGALEIDSATRGDFDAGAMLEAGRFRVGLLVRNVTEPVFGGDRDTGSRLQLDRMARIGVAWGSAWPARSRVIIAADADVTRQLETSGPRRDLSSGVETSWAGGKLAVRSGVRVSTAGDMRPVVAVGTSVRATSVLFLDARAALGRTDDRGWGAGVRVAF